MRRLAGKRALVTGASSGIGAATAQLLAREGADVALLARGDEGLARVAERVEDAGARAITLRADVADREALERAVDQAAAELGGLDIVVVGAAAGTFGRFDELPPVVERALAVLARLGRSAASREPHPNALWEPSGDGSVEGNLGGRPSLVVAARLRGSRPEAL